MAKSETDGVPSVGTMGKFWYAEAGVGVGFWGVDEKNPKPDFKKFHALLISFPALNVEKATKWEARCEYNGSNPSIFKVAYVQNPAPAALDAVPGIN